MPTDETPAKRARYGITVGAACDMPGVDQAEAWRRADEIRDKVANVLAEYGVGHGGPLVNVWDRGDGSPVLP